MVRNREELLERISSYFGDFHTDDDLALLEDFTDTFNELESRANGDGVDWKSKYEENDKAWRKKYRDRFLSSEKVKTDEVIVNEDDEEEEKKKVLSYDELFKEG